jgi:hypothetical protein
VLKNGLYTFDISVVASFKDTLLGAPRFTANFIICVGVDVAK